MSSLHDYYSSLNFHAPTIKPFTQQDTGRQHAKEYAELDFWGLKCSVAEGAVNT